MKSEIIFGVLLVVMVTFCPVTGEKCSGPCDMTCPAGNKSCAQDCAKGPCTMDCDVPNSCAQLCQNNSVCDVISCKSKVCGQLCNGTCPKIECTGMDCSQLCFHETCNVNCEVTRNCSQQTFKPSSTQICKGGHCSQICSGGKCPQTCSGEECDQACHESDGCGQDCTAGERCSQICDKGGCKQSSVAKIISQQCLGKGCTMEATGTTTESISTQFCEGDGCNMEVSSTFNSSMMCVGSTCTATCGAKRCIVFCNSTLSCDLKCKDSIACSLLCKSKKCSLDCGGAPLCKKETELISGLVKGFRSAGNYISSYFLSTLVSTAIVLFITI